MEKSSEPWPLLLGISALGAGLIFGALAMLWSAGPPGIVLTVLWCVPVSATLAACVWFARGQRKPGMVRAWAIVEAIALLGAASLTMMLK